MNIFLYRSIFHWAVGNDLRCFWDEREMKRMMFLAFWDACLFVVFFLDGPERGTKHMYLWVGLRKRVEVETSRARRASVFSVLVVMSRRACMMPSLRKGT